MQSAISESSESEQAVIVLRFAEIFLKGGNRGRFLRALVRHARRLLADIPGAEVEMAHLRVLVRHRRADRRRCIERLGRLFGVSSMSPAEPVENDIDAIAEAAIAAARSIPAGTRFKVETNRRDKRFPLTSPELSREVGGRVALATGLPVDVRKPERVVSVEITTTGAFVFADVIQGPGGLPVGIAGNVSLLLSGGIDSPVAGWSAMRRGCHISAVYFHSFPYTGDKTREKVLDIARLLSRWQGKLAVNVVHFTEVQKALRDHSDGDHALILYRRMMMRAASRLAKRDNAIALVTGENLGQVASQTLENMAAIEDASSLPVLRPLLTYDKHEIVLRAQEIGTFETSILPYDDCCSLFAPRHPVTRASLAQVRRVESGLNLAAMADSLAANADRIVIGE